MVEEDEVNLVSYLKCSSMKRKSLILLLSFSLATEVIGVFLKIDHSAKWLSDLTLALSTISWLIIVAVVIISAAKHKIAKPL